MSRKGNCFDNTAIEKLFGALEVEYFYLATPSSIDALRAATHYYHYFYERVNRGLHGFSPVDRWLKSIA